MQIPTSNLLCKLERKSSQAQTISCPCSLMSVSVTAEKEIKCWCNYDNSRYITINYINHMTTTSDIFLLFIIYNLYFICCFWDSDQPHPERLSLRVSFTAHLLTRLVQLHFISKLGKILKCCIIKLFLYYNNIWIHVIYIYIYIYTS